MILPALRAMRMVTGVYSDSNRALPVLLKKR